MCVREVRLLPDILGATAGNTTKNHTMGMKMRQGQINGSTISTSPGSKHMGVGGRHMGSSLYRVSAN